MKVGFFLGFDYSGSTTERTLPGIIVDLYLMTRAVKMDKLFVITDIDKDPEQTVLLKALLEEVAEVPILSYIQTIKQQQSHILFQDKNQIYQILQQHTLGAEHIFFYYTGHGSKGCLVLPNGELLSSLEIRSLLDGSNREIFAVVDCCHGDGLQLPYMMREGRYKLRSHDFILGRFVCLSSTTPEEESTTSRIGSQFTRDVSKYLQSKFRNLFQLSVLLPNAKISSSYPNLSTIWNWVYGGTLSVTLCPDRTIRIQRYSALKDLRSDEPSNFPTCRSTD